MLINFIRRGYFNEVGVQFQTNSFILASIVKYCLRTNYFLTIHDLHYANCFMITMILFICTIY